MLKLFKNHRIKYMYALFSLILFSTGSFIFGTMLIRQQMSIRTQENELNFKLGLPVQISDIIIELTELEACFTPVGQDIDKLIQFAEKKSQHYVDIHKGVRKHNIEGPFVKTCSGNSLRTVTSGIDGTLNQCLQLLKVYENELAYGGIVSSRIQSVKDSDSAHYQYSINIYTAILSQ